MNWKTIASMAGAAAAAAAITVVSKLVVPLEPVYAQAGISAFIAAVVHKINVWGGA